MECLEEALQNAAKRRAFIRRWAKKLGVPVINLRLPACSAADAKGFPTLLQAEHGTGMSAVIKRRD